MPTTYKVLEPGFYAGRHYSPEGKRKVLTVDTPFTKKNMPSWLAPMPKESEAVVARRKRQEESAAAANAAKVKQDAEDIESASFLGEGEKASGIIETL